jgi:hypothetical protein
VIFVAFISQPCGPLQVSPAPKLLALRKSSAAVVDADPVQFRLD